MSAEEYLELIAENVSRAYDIASKVRNRSCDPSGTPETRLVASQAETIEYLVGLEGLGKRITELSKELPIQEVSFKIAEEIVYGKFGTHSEQDAALLALRAALGVLTPPGTTSAPIEGIVDVKIKLNRDKSRYLSVYYAGPMRSAGGTEQGLSVIFADYIRRLMKLDRYEPMQEEIGRYVEEMRLYENMVGSFQFKASEEQLRFALQRIPIEITGVGTDPYEVTTHRNLFRVGTNRLRGGALRVLIDGLIGRAQKIYNQVKNMNLSGWDWLLEIRAIAHESIYMEKVLIGRPFLSFSNKFGGFRLRYGRSRSTGLAAVGVHPMSMFVVNSFIAIGSQIRLDKPGKSSSVLPVDSIEPPIVKLSDGSVVRVEKEEQYLKWKDSIERILFLGDILVSIGDYVENNTPLDNPGFCEEWWAAELEYEIKAHFTNLSEAEKNIGIAENRLASLIDDPFSMIPTFNEVLKISSWLKVPFHPHYIDFWERISAKQMFILLNRIKQSGERNSEDHIELALDPEVKQILESACTPHGVTGDTIVIDGPSSCLLAKLVSYELPPFRDADQGALDYISSILSIKFIPKSSVFLSARVGRPEAATLRMMNPSVHVIFPTAYAGGPTRNILAPLSKNQPVNIEIADRICPSCNTQTFYLRCEKCQTRTLAIYHCKNCGSTCDGVKCQKCGAKAIPFSTRFIDVRTLVSPFSKEAQGLKLVKGVKSLMNELRVPEPIGKGILRAKYALSVFRDGTCRFDATNVPIVSFKPIEIGLTAERLISLGYKSDIYGNAIERDDQIVHIKPQDLILPNSSTRFLIDLSRFIDEWLSIHGLDPFYNASRRDDLVGQLVAVISPHTLGAIVGRIIGFVDADVCMAHPFFHQAKRRDCDGDADAFTLLLDVFINFSPYYLPSQSGGKMDSPLVMFTSIRPSEIDDQIFNTENVRRIPKAFYDLAASRAPVKSVLKVMEFVKPSYSQPIEFTHPVTNVCRGPWRSTYRILNTMKEKLAEQMLLTEKLDSLVKSSVVEHILDGHLIKDVSGNLRAYYTQKYRCKKCNRKYRRIPLSGHCAACGGEITQTVHVASVVKYVDYIRELVNKYDVDNYYKENVKVIMNEIRWFSLPLEKKQKTHEKKIPKNGRSLLEYV